MSPFLIRAAAQADLEAIASVAIATGQHEEWSGAYPDYVLHLLRHGRVVVAESGGNVSGFGAVQRIGTGRSAITMLCDLFVDPVAHGGGIGRAMLSELWRDSVRRMTFSSLHPHAIPLYTSFGLDAWWPLLYLRGAPARIAVSDDWRIAAASPQQVAELELAWTGIERLQDHQAWAARPNGACVTAGHDGHVLAAGTIAGPADEFGLVHLAIAPESTDATAAAAVQAVLSAAGASSPVAQVCLPGPHPAVRPLLAAGWTIDYVDQFMATEPGLLDPRRAVPSAGQA